MARVFEFFKKNCFFLVSLVLFFLLFPKVKKEIFGDGSDDNSASDYLGGNIDQVNKGVIVGSDGEEYFRYGNKRVRLTTGNKAKVVEYVNMLYMYLSNNTNSVYDWVFDDDLHFYTPEIQATLNDYKRWCNNQETWLHYFAYVWIELHSIQFLDYLKIQLDAEGYDATRTNVKNLNLFYF